MFDALPKRHLTISGSSRVTARRNSLPNFAAEVRPNCCLVRILTAVEAGKFHCHIKFQNISIGPHSLLIMSPYIPSDYVTPYIPSDYVTPYIPSDYVTRTFLLIMSPRTFLLIISLRTFLLIMSPRTFFLIMSPRTFLLQTEH